MPGTTPDRDDLSHNLMLVFKKLKSVRMQRVRSHPEIDMSALPVLFSLMADSPLRVSALAERIHSDVSTVSRQISKLEGLGLIARTADPADGRASVIGMTARGRMVIQDEQRDHAAWISDLLSDWSEADLISFNDHLTRLNHSLGAHDAGSHCDNDSHTNHNKKGESA